MNYYILLIFATIIAILPVIFIKKYIKTKNNIYIILSTIAYLLLLLAYYNIFKLNFEISIVYTLLQVLQIIIVAILGIVFFKENITTNKIIGTIFGIGCIYFLLK